MRLAARYALGAGIIAAITPWLATWMEVALLAGWGLAVVGTARPHLRRRFAGVVVALLVLALVTAAPVVARTLA